MRMWNLLPELMCRQHLLGEHNELHKLHGCLKKGKNLNGYINSGLVELHRLEHRHKELVREMKRRGYEHHSPLVLNKPLPKLGEVDSRRNLLELVDRCHECAKKVALFFMDGFE